MAASGCHRSAQVTEVRFDTIYLDFICHFVERSGVVVHSWVLTGNSHIILSVRGFYLGNTASYARDCFISSN